MPEGRLGLIVSFSFALLLELLVPIVFPAIRLNIFAPVLIFAIYSTSEKALLWLALLCGLIVDMCELAPRFGFYPVTYLVCLLLLYPSRLYFFKDAFSTPLIMTALFSSVSYFISVIIARLIDVGTISLNFSSIATNGIIMPLFDALYAFVVFLLPRYVIRQYYNRKRKRHAS